MAGDMFHKKTSTPPPSKEQILEQENWKLSQDNDHLRTRIEYYNNAVRSIVLRLKILDIEQLKKEMSEEGTIPMRMMLHELISLQKAYDAELDRDCDGATFSDSPSPTSTPSAAPQFVSPMYKRRTR
jgi:predicted DNA binding CopG/RHH family protein